MNSPINSLPSNPFSINHSAAKTIGKWSQSLLILLLSFVISGCAGLQRADLSPDSRDIFLRGFHEVNFLTPTEEAMKILGPALQFPISYPKDRVLGVQGSRDTLNSLYWMKSMPIDTFVSGKVFIIGIAVVDPNYARSYAAIVPGELKCQDDDASKTALAKAYLAKWVRRSSVVPKTQFKIDQGGLVVSKTNKPIGSSLITVKYLKPWNQERLDDMVYTFVFDKIPDDPTGRVMLVGWIKEFSVFET